MKPFTCYCSPEQLRDEKDLFKGISPLREKESGRTPSYTAVDICSFCCQGFPQFTNTNLNWWSCPESLLMYLFRRNIAEVRPAPQGPQSLMCHVLSDQDATVHCRIWNWSCHYSVSHPKTQVTVSTHHGWDHTAAFSPTSLVQTDSFNESPLRIYCCCYATAHWSQSWDFGPPPPGYAVTAHTAPWAQAITATCHPGDHVTAVLSSQHESLK